MSPVENCRPEAPDATVEPVGPGLRLRPLSLGDAARFAAAVAEHGKRIWCYYFPFLVCYGCTGPRRVLWAEAEGSLCAFLVRERAGRKHTDLLFPPLPATPEAATACLQSTDDANGDHSGRVLWADGHDAKALGHLAGLRAAPKEVEYLYDVERVCGLQGRPYRDLRKRVRRFERENDYDWREYREDDAEACHSLLRRWRRLRGRRVRPVIDMGYSKAALELYGRFRREDLLGRVLTLGGKAAAFCMGGRMAPGLANFFIAKSDPEVFGLSEFARWRFLCELRELGRYGLINDASDLGRPGLAQFKRKFRPAEMLEVFTVERDASA
jgi:hypothetical protein